MAFESRGDGDYYGSHDLEDIITVVDGRPEIVEELASAPATVGAFLRGRVAGLLSDEEFHNALPGHVDRGRDDAVLLRLQSISGATKISSGNGRAKRQPNGGGAGP